jgi:hypothetical protein
MTPRSGCRSSLRRFLESISLLAGTGGFPWSVPHHFVLPFPLLIDLDGSELDVIPTAGFSDRILSYLSALSCQLNGVPMLEYGYKKVNVFPLII